MLMAILVPTCRMVAEAAAGKSKHHQVRAAQRARQREAAAALHTTSHGSPPRPTAEKAPTPPASAA